MEFATNKISISILLEDTNEQTAQDSQQFLLQVAEERKR
jgi:hypothetical protein